MTSPITYPTARGNRGIMAAITAVALALMASVCFLTPAAHASQFLPWPDAPATTSCLRFEIPSLDKTFIHWGQTDFGRVAIFDDGRYRATVPDGYSLVDATDGVIEIAFYQRFVGVVTTPCVDPFAPAPPTAPAPSVTDGVNLFSAGLGSPNAPEFSCRGDAGVAPNVKTIERAIETGQFFNLGTPEFDAPSVRSFEPGPLEGPQNVRTQDTTIAEAVEGLTAIDDYGFIGFATDDAANAALGNGGTLDVWSTPTAADPGFVEADGIRATGNLDTDLDGHEIFIFEDGELSGMTITLYPGFDDQDPFDIHVADLEFNPSTQGAADDIIIAIDLDSLPADAPRSVAHIKITDDGIDRRGVSGCDASVTQRLVETAVEIDSIAILKSAFITLAERELE